MTQQCFPLNKCYLWSKKTALPIFFISALYPDLNQINLILQPNPPPKLNNSHRRSQKKKSFYLFSQEFSDFQRTSLK